MVRLAWLAWLAGFVAWSDVVSSGPSSTHPKLWLNESQGLAARLICLPSALPSFLPPTPSPSCAIRLSCSFCLALPRIANILGKFSKTALEYLMSSRNDPTLSPGQSMTSKCNFPVSHACNILLKVHRVVCAWNFTSCLSWSETY